MQRLETIELDTALLEWGQHEARGRLRHLKVSAEQALATRRPITKNFIAVQDVFRARIEFADSPRIRLGNDDRTIPRWREEILADDEHKHIASRDFYYHLIATNVPINSSGMLILMETDSDDALLHVLEGFHRISAWAKHCERGTAYAIDVNVMIHPRFRARF